MAEYACFRKSPHFVKQRLVDLGTVQSTDPTGPYCASLRPVMSCYRPYL
jgi:hypothetical protein